MSLIGSINSVYPNLGIDRPGSVAAPKLPLTDDSGAVSGSKGFGSMLDGLVSMVDGKDAQASALTNSVMLGNSSQLHQSVIAMQEASVALSLMVQVRNKLVDSYQELMRMQV
jgi:flagellar hook-basal body complex protein FliE